MKKEKTVFTTKKIVLSAAVVFSIALGLTTTTVAFANAPGGAYIQCDGGKSSPVRCTPDGW
jgi:multisubunit Na+/H+ antiporter MnhB subunit